MSLPAYDLSEGIPTELVHLIAIMRILQIESFLDPEANRQGVVKPWQQVVELLFRPTGEDPPKVSYENRYPIATKGTFETPGNEEKLRTIVAEVESNLNAISKRHKLGVKAKTEIQVRKHVECVCTLEVDSTCKGSVLSYFRELKEENHPLLESTEYLQALVLSFSITAGALGARMKQSLLEGGPNS